MYGTTLATVAASAVTVLALTGCVSAAPDDDGATTLTLQLWDENVADAYKPSLEAFAAEHPDIDVEVSVVPWRDYFASLRADVAAGSGADVFWLNASYYEDYVDNGLVLPVSEVLDDDDAPAAWNPQRGTRR